MENEQKNLNIQSEQNMIQTMEDILLSHIRYTKKELERELKIIFLQYKKYLTESTTKSEFSQKANILSTKLKKIKNKLTSLKIEEKEMISELNTRFNQSLNFFRTVSLSSFSFKKSSANFSASFKYSEANSFVYFGIPFSYSHLSQSISFIIFSASFFSKLSFMTKNIEKKQIF